MTKRIGEFGSNQLHDVFKITGIITIHYFKYGKNFAYPTESHDFWELVFIDSGEANVYLNDEKLTLKQPEIIFYKPNAPHSISTADKFCNSAIVSFEASGRMLSFFENKIFKLTQQERDILGKIIHEGKKTFKGKLNLVNQKVMEKQENAPFGSEQVIKNNLELLLISIFRNNSANDELKPLETAKLSNHAEKVAENIIRILKDNVYSAISLDDIAKQTYFSKTYVKTAFKKYTGTSIIQYFNRLKIDEAKQLISTNEYTFTEISKKLGFSSVHYFTRLFKAVTDMTPSEYQNSIKADNVLD